MKALFVLLVLSIVTVLVVVSAMWWRLHHHLSKSDKALKDVLQEIHPEHEPVEHG
ncbi:MAG TPA: hypothetical protein VKZ53_03455 [Candidatus Angelobacter sp.]|nr:hypothetical protein [Candidatus Angelobacter sp.]